MNFIKYWTKISYIVALILSFFYGLSTLFFLYLKEPQKAVQAGVVSGVFFVLSLVLSKVKGQNKSFKKIMQAQTFLIQNHKMVKDLGTEKQRISYLLLLSDKIYFDTFEERMFPETNWNFKDGTLTSEAFEVAANMINRLESLVLKGMDVTLMVKFNELGEKDLKILKQAVKETEGWTYTKLRNYVGPLPLDISVKDLKVVKNETK